jgi:hypothetical protein
VCFCILPALFVYFLFTCFVKVFVRFQYDSFFDINLDELRRLGRDFPWPIPERCLCCGGRLWKHDFVTYFLFPYFDQPFSGRRLRCPDCRTTFRCRPKGYLPRFFYPLKLIKESLFRKSSQLSPAPVGLETQRSWLKRLKYQIRAHLGLPKLKDRFAGFLKLLEKRIVPVSRSLISEIQPAYTLSTNRHLFQNASFSDWLK